MQLQRDGADGLEIGGDVIALGTVAARDAEGKFAVPVMEADGHAVHLGFHHILHVIPAGMFADGGIERAQFGQGLFILRAITFFAVGLLGAGGMIAGGNLVQR